MSLNNCLAKCSTNYFDVIKKFISINNSTKVIQSIISNIENNQVYTDNASDEEKDAMKCIMLSLKVFMKLSGKASLRLEEIDNYVEE